MDRKEAIKALEYELSCVDAESPRGELAEPALIMAIEALSAEPTVIRSKVLMPTKDFKEWAKRVREENPNAIIIPCDAEVVSTETTTETSTDLISRADAIAKAKYLVNRWIGVTGKAYEEKVPLIEEVFNAIPSAKVPTKCIAEIKIDADEASQKIKEKYDLADRPSVAYICDGTACDGKCDECHHTTDIEHAKNFKCVGGKYIETADRPSREWIPVKWHEITDEEREREGYPKDWVVYIDCEMPCDNQEILVQTKNGYIRWDVCYEDGEFSLDSGWDWV